ncbi:hypothetical protein NDN94_07535 [Burkholderia glumae]|uniref:hypothetical protein n=1 Tax=Burkholderia glumae TaxID=337 RepID=UPI002036EFEE|nr:hypothetical protein [Burkholderia glumae]MCM2537678.1 hypothetical protein [Burkholderia glumae]
MSDKLSDEQIEAAKTAGFSWHPIWKCLVVRHSNGAWSEVSDKLARFAALLAASPAPAIPADDPVGVPRALLASLVDDVEEYAGRHSFREREQEVRAREIARARVILAAPAISESEDARDAARYRLILSDVPDDDRMDLAMSIAFDRQVEVFKVQDETPEAILDRVIDAARKGEKS